MSIAIPPPSNPFPPPMLGREKFRSLPNSIGCHTASLRFAQRNPHLPSLVYRPGKRSFSPVAPRTIIHPYLQVTAPHFLVLDDSSSMNGNTNLEFANCEIESVLSLTIPLEEAVEVPLEEEFDVVEVLVEEEVAAEVPVEEEVEPTGLGSDQPPAATSAFDYSLLIGQEKIHVRSLQDCEEVSRLIRLPGNQWRPRVMIVSEKADERCDMRLMLTHLGLEVEERPNLASITWGEGCSQSSLNSSAIKCLDLASVTGAEGCSQNSLSSSSIDCLNLTSITGVEGASRDSLNSSPINVDANERAAGKRPVIHPVEEVKKGPDVINHEDISSLTCEKEHLTGCSKEYGMDDSKVQEGDLNKPSQLLHALSEGGFVQYGRAGNGSYGDDIDWITFGKLMDKATRSASIKTPSTQYIQRDLQENLGCPIGNKIPEFKGLEYFQHPINGIDAYRIYPNYHNRISPSTIGSPRRTQKKVAVVGSGPVALGAADQLNRMGHNVSVHMSSDRVVGLTMNGLPDMKGDQIDVVQKMVNHMKEDGINFVVNSQVGKDPAYCLELLGKENDAILVTEGSAKPRDLPVPGCELGGVHFAMEFHRAYGNSLRDDNLESGNYISAKDKKVLVIGGGDTAAYCIGTCIQQGCDSIVNLELLPQPPNSSSPYCPLLQEVATKFGKKPSFNGVWAKKFVGDENGHVKALEIVRVQSETCATGAFKFKEIGDTIEADLVLIARGYLGPELTIADKFVLEKDNGSNFKAEYGRFSTSVEGVFTARDSRGGQSLLESAISEGRQAALEVDKYIMKDERDLGGDGSSQ